MKARRLLLVANGFTNGRLLPGRQCCESKKSTSLASRFQEGFLRSSCMQLRDTERAFGRHEMPRSAISLASKAMHTNLMRAD